MAESSNAPDLAPDVLIARFSWRPNYSMISIPDEPIKPTILARTLASSLGFLDTLPIELLHMILKSMDVQNLLRFAQVCHQAKALVDSLLCYQDLVKHASATLIALSRTKLITVHAVGTIHAALLSDQCVSCQKFGAFLFLPTCERCCHWCLRSDRSLRVICSQTARTCFGLSKKDLGQIPMMLSIPGEYVGGGCTSRNNAIGRCKVGTKLGLYSLKQVEKVGISVHGSQDAMKRVCVLQTRTFGALERLPVLWLSGATSDSEPQLPSIYTLNSEGPLDTHGGMASINFPSLRPNHELENGLWCLGCRALLQSHCGHAYGFHSDEADNYFPIRSFLFSTDAELATRRILSGMERQARSTSDFLEHLKVCQGRRLVSKVETQ